MARKLSEITRCGPVVAAIAATLLVAAKSLAEEGAGPTAPPAVVLNPFSPDAAQPTAVGSDSRSPRREETNYPNPFANHSPTPHATPLFSGPMSRWRPITSPFDDVSPVKEAILSAETITDIHIPAGRLSPAETAGGRSVSDSGGAVLADPPDPVRFATTPLAQPAWLVGDSQPAAPLSPVGQASFNQPIASGDASPWAGGPGQAASPYADLAPIVITDFDDSPEGWLAQARQAASTAGSLDDLSTVAALCQRGLAASPTAEHSTALRQLAAWAHNRRGELLADADQQRDAMKDFQSAIALDANCSAAIHNRAVTLAEQKQLTAALRDFDRVIELDPDLAMAYRNRAELLATLGRTKKALGDYDRAIESFPDDAELYAARAYARQRIGDFDGAREDLNRALEIAPHSPKTLAQRGNLAADRGDFDRARADFQRAIAVDSNCAEAYRSMAWLQATCADERYRDSEGALSAARRAVELSSSGDYLALDTLAAAHAAAGQFDDAVRIAQQAVSAAPPEFAKPLQQRLALYRARRPFRSSPNGAP